MSTAVVETPVDIKLAETTAEAFSGTSSFIGTTSVTKDGTPAATESSTTETAKEDYFIFSDTPFVDLQAYLMAGMRMPENQALYELLYPRNLFQARLKQYDEGLYDRTRMVFNDIHNHCATFKGNTFNMMISTAGHIANFSEKAAEKSDIAKNALPIICAPGAKFTDLKVEKALGTFVDAINSLKSEAKKAAEQCNDKVKAIGMFRDVTHNDKERLENVKSLNEKWLPSVEDLDNENKAKMGAAYDTLNRICKEQNKKYDSLKPFVKFFTWVPILSTHVAFADLRKEIEAVNGIRKATAEYQTVYDSASTEMRSSLRFRGQLKHLMNSMNDVLVTIAKAEKALSDMAGWFSSLETRLAAVESVLEEAIGHASDNKWAFQRAKAYDDLNNARNRWIKIVDLAERFQARGLITSSDIDKKLQEEIDPAEKNIEILSTNYGGNNVTEFSQVLFRYGASIRIRSIEPGFPDPWDGVVKTISMIHSYDNWIRLFICKEYTAFHELLPGPISNYKGGPRVAVELNTVKTRIATADIELLAVAYGPEDVTFKRQKEQDQTVMQYIYTCAENGQPVVFNNEKMGGDSWPGYSKSGTVFYRAAGGKMVLQLTGREGEAVEWPHMK